MDTTPSAVPASLIPSQGAVATPSVAPVAGAMSVANALMSAAPAAGPQLGATPLGGTASANPATAPKASVTPVAAPPTALTAAQQAQAALAAKNVADAKAAAQGGLTDAQVAEKVKLMQAQASAPPVPAVPISTEAAKAAADVVTSSNLRDGVAEALERWVLGQRRPVAAGLL